MRRLKKLWIRFKVHLLRCYFEMDGILKKKKSGKLKSLTFIGNLPKIEDVEEKPQAENSKLEDIEHLEKVGETKDVILP